MFDAGREGMLPNPDLYIGNARDAELADRAAPASSQKPS